MITLIFSFVFPFSSVFAEEDIEKSLIHDYVDLVEITASDKTPDLKKVYDRDLNTGALLNYSNQYLKFTFKKPVNIKNVFIKYSGDEKTKTRIITTKSEVIELEGLWVNGYNDVNYENVLSIEIYQKTGLYYYNLYEIDFFGSPVEMIPEIENIKNIEYEITSNSILFSYELPTNENFSHIKILANGKEYQTSKNNFILEELEPNTEYEIKFISVDTLGNESIPYTLNIKTLEETDPTKIPPSNPTALSITDLKDTSVSLKWQNSNDDDLDSVNIYIDGVIYKNIPLTSDFTIMDLKPNTTYKIGVALVDKDGNVSVPSTIVVTTEKEYDMIPPNKPQNIQIEVGSKSLFAKWKANSEDDLEGYNIYVNGEKINDTLIKTTHFAISGLENGKSYQIQVTAVDYSGNESLKSEIVEGIPSEKAIPFFKLNYTLQDVATAVSNWFSSYWMIIAFSASIPLSFYIASRIKLMFID